MNDEIFIEFTTESIRLLIIAAREARKSADNSEKECRNYNQGILMGYYSILTLLKHQAFAFSIDQKELGLADIKPDVDLLGLHRNPDMDFGEDNWAIDVMNEKKVKGYLSDSIKLLKKQVKEVKMCADNSKIGDENYNKGLLTAYCSVISLLKKQAFTFNIDEKDVGLNDLDPESGMFGPQTG